MLIMVSLVISKKGSSQNVLVNYPFTNDSPSPQNVAQDLEATNFKISSGNITFNSSAPGSWTDVPYAQGGSGWDAANTGTAKYFYFTLDADITKLFDITRLSFEYRATANGPSALTVIIDTTTIDTIDVSSDETKMFDTTFSNNDHFGYTTADIKIIGWDNSSRSTSGGGDFRVDEIKLEGEVKLRPVVIDFDYDRWKEGSGVLKSYQKDHEYEDLGVFFTGGDALRETNSDQDGFPAALGEYAWRMNDADDVSWTARLNRCGDIYGFGLKVRRWDDGGSIDYNLKYSTDSGQTFTNAKTITNNFFNDSSDWMSYQHQINSKINVQKGDFVVKLEAKTDNAQQIMLDDFQYTLDCTEPEGWSVDAEDQLFSIDFDSTLNSVNKGIFKGKGFSYAPALGELDSRAWCITGVDGENLDFGNFKRNDDFAQGVSSGGVGLGGVYAFEVETGNHGLGFQQTSDNFTPGEIILKIKNQTANTISELALAYKIYHYNDQSRSGSVKLSYSSDNHIYTPLSTLDFVSKETSDASASWKANLRTTTLSGLSINDGEYFYLRWDVDDVSGSGTRDEFALDDIQLVANPVDSYPPVDSTYQTVAIEGRRTLSNDLAVSDTLTLANSVVHTGNHKIRFENGCQVRGYGIQNYINGTVKTTGKNNYIIPVGYRQGQENHYGQVFLDNSSGSASDEFTITYTYDTPPNRSEFNTGDGGLQTLSNLEYWKISRISNTSTPDITLHWDDNDDGTSGVNDPSNIEIAHWDSVNGSWESFGQNSSDGNGSNGSVTIENVDDFSIFTLGSTSNTDPLPVELLSFYGYAEKEHKIIRWSTASEQNNDFFTLEKSLNGEEFEVVTTITGAGNSNEIVNYKASDNEVDQEITYYRLKQTDYDGQYTYSEIISVKQEAGETDEMTVNYWCEQNKLKMEINQLDPGGLGIEMYDMAGNRIRKEKYQTRQNAKFVQWDISHLNSGIYLIKVLNNQNASEHKLMVQ